MKKLFVLLLIFASCAKSSDSILKEFNSKKSYFHQIVFDVKERFVDYESYFTVKNSDDSFSLNHKTISDKSLLPLSSSGKYLTKNQDIEMVVFNDTTIWFRKEISENPLSAENEILIYSKESKRYIDSLINHHYSKKNQTTAIDKYWYFVTATKYID